MDLDTTNQTTTVAAPSRTPARRARRPLVMVLLVMLAAVGGVTASAQPASAATCSDGGLNGWWYNPSSPATISDLHLGLVCNGSQIYFNANAWGSCGTSYCYLGQARTSPYGADWLRASYPGRTVYLRQLPNTSFRVLQVHTYTGGSFAEDYLVPSS